MQVQNTKMDQNAGQKLLPIPQFNNEVNTRKISGETRAYTSNVSNPCTLKLVRSLLFYNDIRFDFVPFHIL